MSDSMPPYGQQPTRLFCPQDSLGKNTGMGCHFLLQWKTERRFLISLEIKLTYDPAIPLLGIHTEETRIERDTRIPMFIAAPLTIARTWKQPRCPVADEWIRKLYIYTMESYNEVDETEVYYTE